MGGAEYSLNDIEHPQIRQRWDAPLVHACVVCGSVSCPDLRNEAFEASTLASQMKDSFALWMQNPAKGLLLQPDGAVKLSRIFLWFQKDFGPQRWDSLAFIIANTPPGDKSPPGPETASAVDYFEYDWGINARP